MEVLIIGSIAPIILICLKTAFAERCVGVDGQRFPSPTSPPPPPEFPDFMSAFGGTLLRIGMENLWPQERQSCPYSVNWSTFNARLCGSDPFDLDSFCRSLSITTAEPPPTVAAPALTTPENRPSATDVENPVHAITVASPLVRTMEDVLHVNTTTEPFQSDAATASDFPALPVIHPDSALSQSPPPPPPLPPSPPSQMSSPASPVDSSSFAAPGALTGGGSDARLAIGVTLFIVAIVVCVIIFVIFSRRRLGKCQGVRRSMVKFIQRQRSDVQPLSTPSPSLPSTPLQAMYSNPLTTNNNVAETSDVETNGISLTKHLDLDAFQSSVDLENSDDR